MQKYIKLIPIIKEGVTLLIGLKKGKKNVFQEIQNALDKQDNPDEKILMLQRIIEYSQSYQSTLIEIKNYEKDLKTRKDERFK